MAQSPRYGGDAPKKPLQGLDDEPRRASLGERLAKALVVIALFVLIGLVAAYSAMIGRPPWSWNSQDFSGFLTFSRQRAESARDRIAEIDWSNVRTKVTEKTRELWNDLPEIEKKIEDRIARARGRRDEKVAQDTTTASGGSDRPAVGASREAGGEARPRPPSAYEKGLAKMRDGITHYRRSPDDADELAKAKKCFEEAQAELEKAVKEEQDHERRQEAAATLQDCNRYLEDCRSREKS